MNKSADFEKYMMIFLLKLKVILKHLKQKWMKKEKDKPKTAIEKMDVLIDVERKNKNFVNARFACNIYEKTIIKHANNTKNIKDSMKLLTIDKDDIDF